MKSMKEIIQRDYELTYLLAGDLLDADVARIKKEISELVEKYKKPVLIGIVALVALVGAFAFYNAVLLVKDCLSSFASVG